MSTKKLLRPRMIPKRALLNKPRQPWSIWTSLHHFLNQSKLKLQAIRHWKIWRHKSWNSWGCRGLEVVQNLLKQVVQRELLQLLTLSPLSRSRRGSSKSVQNALASWRKRWQRSEWKIGQSALELWRKNKSRQKERSVWRGLASWITKLLLNLPRIRLRLRISSRLKEKRAWKDSESPLIVIKSKWRSNRMEKVVEKLSKLDSNKSTLPKAKQTKFHLWQSRKRRTAERPNWLESWLRRVVRLKGVKNTSQGKCKSSKATRKS